MADTKISALTTAADLTSMVLAGETGGVNKAYTTALFDARYPPLANANTFTTSQTIQLTDATNLLYGLTVDQDGGNFVTRMFRYIASAGGPVVAGFKARGSRGSPTAVLSGDSLYGFRGFGYTGSAFTGVGNDAAMLFEASENFVNASNYGSQIRLMTVQNATTTSRTVATFGNDGMLTLAGSFSRAAPVTKTADFTVAITENWLINNKAAATCTVTLPTASSFTGREITIKNLQAFTVVSASSNVVPLAGGAAAAAILAATAGKWATLVSDGTNWVIMAGA